MRNDAHVDAMDGLPSISIPSHPLSSIVEEEGEEELSDNKQKQKKHDRVGTSSDGLVTSLTKSQMWRDNIYNVDDELIKNAGSRRHLKYVFVQNGRNVRDTRNSAASGHRTFIMVNLQELRDLDNGNLTHETDNMELSPPRSKSLHI
eukprot:scaffold8363_cov58-Attheya_sp.AAC.3